MNGRLDAQARAAAIVNTHGPALLRVAQRVSLCSDDAQDAVQRALEIYWRKVDTIDPASEAAWLRVVVRNEALEVRRARQESVTTPGVDLDLEVADVRPLEERAESTERIGRTAEALRHLKRDEATALMLKAEGHTYDEIGERLDWSRTKVNRAISEGRARLFRVFRGIESGEQCERFAPLLEELASGEADADSLMPLRPHLRHCRSCRAAVRHLHTSRLQRAASLLPIPAFLRPSHVYAWFGRVAGADPTMAAAGSGGRGLGTAALVGLCIGGVGAGSYCVATGRLPDPVTAIVRSEEPRTPAAPPKRRPVPPVAAASSPSARPPRPSRPTRSSRRRAPRRQPSRLDPVRTPRLAAPPEYATPVQTVPSNDFSTEFTP